MTQVRARQAGPASETPSRERSRQAWLAVGLFLLGAGAALVSLLGPLVGSARSSLRRVLMFLVGGIFSGYRDSKHQSGRNPVALGAGGVIVVGVVVAIDVAGAPAEGVRGGKALAQQAKQFVRLAWRRRGPPAGRQDSGAPRKR